MRLSTGSTLLESELVWVWVQQGLQRGDEDGGLGRGKDPSMRVAVYGTRASSHSDNRYCMGLRLGYPVPVSPRGPSAMGVKAKWVAGLTRIIYHIYSSILP